MKTVIRGALSAAILGAASVAGYAADLPSYKAPPPLAPAFVDTYQPFQVRLNVSGVVPLAGHGTAYDEGILNTNPAFAGLLAPFNQSIGLATGLSGGPGSVIPGASTNTSFAVIPTLDVSYYLNKNWAVEAICCIVPAHIQGTGTIASTFAHTWVFPPSLLLQYHFTNFGAFQPYLGVGVNFTAYFGTRVNNEYWPLMFSPTSAVGGLGVVGGFAQFYHAQVTPSWGVVGQAGVDYMFNEHWGVNLDVKYILMEPIVHAGVAVVVPQIPSLGVINAPVKVALPIDPLVVSAGITYRFGGGSVAPVFAKY